MIERLSFQGLKIKIILPLTNSGMFIIFVENFRLCSFLVLKFIKSIAYFHCVKKIFREKSLGFGGEMEAYLKL